MKLKADQQAGGAPVRLVSSRPEPTDTELAQALIRGESWAPALAWERHAPMVYGLVERALGPTGEAEDLTQDVFLAVFDKVRSLQNPAALRSFIYSFAVRHTKWELRRKRVRRFLMLSNTGKLPDAAGRGSNDETREAIRRFYAALDELGASERTAFALRHFECMTVKEVVEAMRLSPATVKRRLRSANQTVSKYVEGDTTVMAYLKRSGAVHDQA